jgi:hypothetical protein
MAPQFMEHLLVFLSILLGKMSLMSLTTTMMRGREGGGSVMIGDGGEIF